MLELLELLIVYSCSYSDFNYSIFNLIFSFFSFLINCSFHSSCLQLDFHILSSSIPILHSNHVPLQFNSILHSSSIPIFHYSSIPILHSSSIPMFHYSSISILHSSSIHIFHYSFIPIFHSHSVLRYRGQLVHMIVDTSQPLSKGSVFYETFRNQQEKPDQWSLQRLVIRSILE